jgi:hypothetical protein
MGDADLDLGFFRKAGVIISGDLVLLINDPIFVPGIKKKVL